METAVSVAYIAATGMQIIVLALAAAVLFQLLRVIGNLRAISERARRGADALADDLDELRVKVRTESRDTWSGLKLLARGILRRFGLIEDTRVQDD